MSPNQMIQEMRNWEAEQTRTDPSDSINSAIEDLEIDYGSDGSTKQEELLQLPSN